MRKFLLLIAVALFSTATYAQLWNASISAVGEMDAVDFKSPAVMDKEGNLYVTGTQTQNFEFAGKDAEVLAIGAYIAKYNAKGEELFAITLHGSISITAITTDAENNLYVAGAFADEAYITDIEGVSGKYEIVKNSETDSRTAAFIAKYDANGNLLAVNSYEAALNVDAFDKTKVAISKIVADNSKIYVQFDYTGDVTIEENLSLEAKSAFYDFGGWGMAVLINNVSVISFDANLDNASAVAGLAISDKRDPSTSIKSFAFAVEGENVYVAALATGNVVLTTSAGDEAFDFEYDGMGTTERGAILAKVGTKSVKFSNVPTSVYAPSEEIVAMDIKNGEIYLAGTFGITCAFDSTKVAVGASDVFVASVNAETLAVNYVSTNANDEGATNQYFEEVSGVVFSNESVYVISGVVDMNGATETVYNNYNVAYDGTVNVATEALPATTVAYNDNAKALINCTGETSINVYAISASTGIENVDAEAENAVIYDLTGRRIAELTKAGIYIVNGNKVLVK